MMDRLDEQLRQLLEGELPPDEEQRALHAIAEDSDARALLRQEFDLNRLFHHPADLGMAVPDGFSDRVMRSLAPEPVPVPAWVERMWLALMAPRPVAFRPAYALASLLLLAAVLTIGLPQGTEQPTGVVPAADQGTVVYTRFLYVDEAAGSVAVAGDFTDWQPVTLTPERVGGETVWSGIVAVPQGEHRYMFVIDQREWVTDPLAPVQRDDGFGNTNAVLVL